MSIFEDIDDMVSLSCEITDTLTPSHMENESGLETEEECRKMIEEENKNGLYSSFSKGYKDWIVFRKRLGIKAEEGDDGQA